MNVEELEKMVDENRELIIQQTQMISNNSDLIGKLLALLGDSLKL